MLALLIGTLNVAYAAPLRVKGIVLNATRMKPAAGLKIELVRPDAKSSTGTLISTATTTADGRFDFGTLDISKEDLLLTRAVHQGYGYLAAAYDGAGTLKDFGVKATPANVQIQVYDSTSTPPKLKFMVHHLAIESSEQGIKCTERIVVENPAKSTFTGIGSAKGTVLLDLPKGARDIKLDPKIPGKMVKTSHGWMATTPIVPSAYNTQNPLAGPNAIIYSYYVDWPSVLPWARQVDLSQKILYPTNFFFVARTTEDKVLQVTAPKLSADTPQQLPIDEQQETRLVNSIGAPMSSKPALDPETPLSIQVRREVNPLFWAFLAFIIAFCLAVPVVLRTGRKRSAASEWDDDDDLETSVEPASATLVNERTSTRVSETERASQNASATDYGAQNGAIRREGLSPAVLSPQAQKLIEQIAQLDEEHAAGGLEDALYQSRRAAWKEQVIEMLAAEQPPVKK
jgi:hypothetical protein